MKVLTISVFKYKSPYFFSGVWEWVWLKKNLTGATKSYFTIKFDAQNICVWSYQLYSNLNTNFCMKIFMLYGIPNSNLLKICS